MTMNITKRFKAAVKQVCESLGLYPGGSGSGSDVYKIWVATDMSIGTSDPDNPEAVFTTHAFSAEPTVTIGDFISNLGEFEQTWSGTNLDGSLLKPAFDSGKIIQIVEMAINNSDSSGENPTPAVVKTSSQVTGYSLNDITGQEYWSYVMTYYNYHDTSSGASANVLAYSSQYDTWNLL